MKQGVTFEQLVNRVEHESRHRQDYYVPTAEMQLMTDGSGSRLATPCGQFAVKNTAHLHLAEMCGIDRRYYQRMRVEAPYLLDRNVNHWLRTNAPKQRILRALQNETGPQARAIVSSRYATLDNDALLRTLEPVIDEMGLTVESCDISEEKLTLKMVSPRLTGAVKVGDEVQVGIMVRNSEVRFSAVEVDWFVKRLVCTNGMVLARPGENGTSRKHVGSDWDAAERKARGDNGSFTYGRIPENVARKQWEKAIWDQLQRSLCESLNTSTFGSLMGRLVLTTTLQTKLTPEKLVQRLGKRFSLAPQEQSMVLHHLEQEHDLSVLDPVSRGDLNLWNLLNAVTRTAQDVGDYARATALEEMGGQLATFTPGQWSFLVLNQ